jgi:solute carrier family 25 protein 16
LEVIRSRLAFEIRQTSNEAHVHRHHYHHRHHKVSYGIIPTCRIIYQENNNSLRGFYKGFVPTMLGIIPYAGAAFMSYQYLKDQCLYTWSSWAMQPSHPTVASSTFDSSAAAANPKSPSQTPSTDKTTNRNRPKLKLWVHLLIGGVAGLIGQTVAYPFDTIRHRMQLEGIAKGIPRYRGTWDALKLIWKHESVRGFFWGLSINYWKTIPANAVGFVSYDYLKRFFQI